jgi:hypothetical protein
MLFFQLNGNLVFAGLGAIVLFFLILWTTYAILKLPQVRNRQLKLIAMIIWQLFLLALTVYAIFLLLPLNWTSARSLQIANEFMSNLNKRDYQSAKELISSAMSVEYYDEIKPSIQDPANQPLSWKLEITGGHPPLYIATGTVTLPGSKETPVSIYIDWDWKTLSWKINGVWYRQFDSTSNTGIFFDLYSTDTEFLIVTSTILSIVISIFMSTKYLLNLFRPKRDY